MKKWSLIILSLVTVLALSAYGSWSSSSNELGVTAEIKNTKKVKEGIEFPESGIVNLTYWDEKEYFYTLGSKKDVTLDVLESPVWDTNISGNDKNIAWEYATFQAKNGTLKVEVTKNPEEIVTYVLSIVEGDEVREVTFNIIPEGGEVLPPQEVSITTSWPVVSGADTDDILAENGPHIPVEVSLSVNSPYTLSSNSLTFNPINEWEIETQTVNILNNWQIVWNKSVTVTWQ